MSREEIDLTRLSSEAEARLQQFCPEPPFGPAAVSEFQACQSQAEELRASLLRARRERVAHTDSHALTMRR